MLQALFGRMLLSSDHLPTMFWDDFQNEGQYHQAYKVVSSTRRVHWIQQLAPLRHLMGNIIAKICRSVMINVALLVENPLP